MADETTMPEMEERVVAHVFASYRSVERDYTGKLREIYPTGNRGDTVLIPKDEARRLDQFGALAPPGWTPTDVAGAIESRRRQVEETIRRGINPTEGLSTDLFGGPRVTVSAPSLGAAPEGFATTRGDTGGPDTPVPAVPPRGPYEMETGAEDVPYEVVRDAAPGSPMAQTPDAEAHPPVTPGGRAEVEQRQQTAEGGRSGGGGSAGSFDARGKPLTEVEQWIRESKPNAEQTVAAAKDDPEAAETLIEAEGLAHGGDPRSTVEGRLRKIVEREGTEGGE